MFHTSSISLSKAALKNNINFLKQKIGSEVILSSVVKGNAYGHGLEQFVKMAESLGIRHFSVFSAEEAYRVFQARKLKKTVILIMGQIENDQMEWAIQEHIEFYVFELDRLHAAIKTAKKIGQKAIVHIEVETGMNRTGFENKMLSQVAALLKENQDYITFKGLCTHYAGAESISNYVRVRDQIKCFNEFTEYFKNLGLSPQLRHTSCSASTISYPETHMDMVRVGILLYGFWPSRETLIEELKGVENPKDPLRRVISWKSKIMSTKQVRAGDFIGYGTSYQASGNMCIATVPVGYGYGFSRSLSNVGRVLIRGKRAGVLGVVNMNLMIIDITQIKGVEKGDEVILIGTQKNESVSVASFGELSNQPNYELLTRLPADIPRQIAR